MARLLRQQILVVITAQGGWRKNNSNEMKHWMLGSRAVAGVWWSWTMVLCSTYNYRDRVGFRWTVADQWGNIVGTGGWRRRGRGSMAEQQRDRRGGGCQWQDEGGGINSEVMADKWWDKVVSHLKKDWLFYTVFVQDISQTHVFLKAGGGRRSVRVGVKSTNMFCRHF